MTRISGEAKLGLNLNDSWRFSLVSMTICLHMEKMLLSTHLTMEPSALRDRLGGEGGMG
jgi:hypothetical protein